MSEKRNPFMEKFLSRVNKLAGASPQATRPERICGNCGLPLVQNETEEACRELDKISTRLEKARAVAPVETPRAVKIGFCDNPRVKLIQAIPAAVEKDQESGQFVASFARGDSDEWGHGDTETGAMEDLSRCAAESFLHLREIPDDKLSANLAKQKSILGEYFALRAPAVPTRLTAREWLIKTRGYSGSQTLVTKLDILAADREAFRDKSESERLKPSTMAHSSEQHDIKIGGYCIDCQAIYYDERWHELKPPTVQEPDTNAWEAESNLWRERAAGLREEIERLKRERGPQTVEDGFGSSWPPCEKHNCEMQVMRPGDARCHECETEDYIDRLNQELTELRAKLAEQELAILKWELIAGANAARAEAAEAEVAALREREKDGK